METYQNKVEKLKFNMIPVEIVYVDMTYYS